MATTPRAKRDRRPFRVWCAITVFVQGDQEGAPWTKRSRGRPIIINASDMDAAMQAGERELARQLGERFNLGTPK
jgi:hypothetical protein